MNPAWSDALAGGILIGIAVSLMLLWSGRVTGISGILYQILTPAKGETSWRVSFILGLVSGGAFLMFFRPMVFVSNAFPADWQLWVAGLLVGFGSVLGSGCTSGHGVCGVSRLSPRSLIATPVFIISGIAIVFLLKKTGALS